MALPPQRVNRQPEGQGAVRRAALELTLEEFNKEMGSKMAASLAQYHARFVEPRLQVIEMILGIWQFRWFRDTILPLYYLPDRYPEVKSSQDQETAGPVVSETGQAERYERPAVPAPAVPVGKPALSLGDGKIPFIDRRASSMTPGDDGNGK